MAPVVDAGLGATIQLPQDSVALDATVTDDGLPAGATVTTTWTVQSGPAGATFADANAVDTTVTFPGAGTYVLLLTADDTALQGSDTVQVIVQPAGLVNTAPVVNAGVDATIRLPVNSVALDGTVTDDGLPAGGTLTTAWTLQSGPAGVTFGNAAAVDTTATFPGEGTYVLLLTADDSDLQASDTVQVTVEAAPAVASVTVAPSSVTLAPGATQAFSASGTDQYGDPITPNVTWSATGGTIDAAGNFTAGANTGTFEVTATDGAVVGTASVTINPAAPTGLTASGEDGVVVLDWNDNTEPGLASYSVKRSVNQGGPYATVAPSVVASNFDDNTVTNATTYYYVVTATDGGGNESANSNEVAVTPNGPVNAFWTMDEGAPSTTIADTVAPDDGTGTISGATWTTEAISGGQALDFDGNLDSVVIDNTPQLNITGKAITLQAWIFPRNGGVLEFQGGAGRTLGIISKRNEAGDSGVFGMLVDDYRLVFRLDGQDMVSSHILVLNEWVHVAMVYNGADMRIYINGALDAATPVAKTDPIDFSSNPVHLGTLQGEVDHDFDGIIDDVQILNSVLLPGVKVPPARGAGLYFDDITAIAGTANPPDGGHGVMFAEVDNDSDVDYYLTNNNGDESGLRADLFYDNTNGVNFAEVGAARGIDDVDGGSNGAVWADLDNDGDYDLVNGTRWDVALPDGGVPTNDNIYENLGPATPGFFADVTPAVMQAVAIENRAVTALDMNGDGYLDIYGKGGPTGDPNEAFLNDGDLDLDGIGDFSFTSHAGGDLATAPGKEGITDTDYDGDGDIDILAANPDGELVILDNNGSGIFTLVSAASLGIVDAADDAITSADVDNDGDLDLLLVGGGTGRLYRRSSSGGLYELRQTFRNIHGYMGGFADLDNDGDLDLVFSGDEKIFVNDGLGRFTSGQSVPVSGITDPRAIAFADIDSDGDLDFAITAKLSRNWLVRNDNPPDNNWLRVRLVSPQCQVGALGAKVRIFNGATLVGLREVNGNNGYLAQNDPVVHFGLGNLATVDIVVDWVDGTQSNQAGVGANQTFLIDACPP